MNISSQNVLNNIFPEVSYAILRESDPSSWYLPKTTLDFHNFMIIYEGEATFFRNGTKIKGKKRNLIYYRPNDIREAYTSETNPAKFYAVEFLYTCPVLDDSKWYLSDESLPFDFCETIGDSCLFNKLIDLFSEVTSLRLTINTTKNPTTAVIKERAVFMEILALLFQYKDSNQKYRHQYNYANIARVDKLINYMAQHYYKPLNLKVLADYLEISPSYLGGMFKSITGKSVISYLIDIRITKAKQFLKDGLSVSDTVQKVGFNDIFYFSRIFKQREGITPSEFIKTNSCYHSSLDILA